MMNPQDFLVKVNEFCPELVEPSWVPQKCLRSKRSPILASKFGGCSPWVSADWSWPRCNTCDRPTSFLLQINLADLPRQFKTKTKLSNGLLQIFDCTGCFKYSGLGFGSARIVPQQHLEVSSLQYLAAVSCEDSGVSRLPSRSISGESQLSSRLISGVSLLPSRLQNYVCDVLEPQGMHPHWEVDIPLQVFKECFIGDWKKNDLLEIPDNDEWDLLDAAADKLGLNPEDIQDIDYKDLKFDGEVKLGGPSSGTKIGGWFDWDASLGYPGYPKCSECSGNPLMDTIFMQFSIHDLFPANEFTPLKSRGYPDFIFVSICPFCHAPALFESFPPPLEYF